MTLPPGCRSRRRRPTASAPARRRRSGLNEGDAGPARTARRSARSAIDTPLLNDPLKGSIYLAPQGNNPFNSLLAIYLVASAERRRDQDRRPCGAGPDAPASWHDVRQHAAATVQRLRADVQGRAPRRAGQPRDLWELDDDRAADLVGRARGVDDRHVHDRRHLRARLLAVVRGRDTNPGGGATTSFTMNFGRTDADDDFGRSRMTMPPGLLGNLIDVRCAVRRRRAGTCARRAGSARRPSARAGPRPFTCGGGVALTGPYKGAPFGLSIVVPAMAGPVEPRHGRGPGARSSSTRRPPR